MTEYEAWLVLNHRISRYDHAEDINEALELAKAALEKQNVGRHWIGEKIAKIDCNPSTKLL